MLDSSAQSIARSIHELSREVHSLQYEVSRVREKLSLQPEWFLVMFEAAVLILIVGLFIVAVATKDRTASRESPRIEAQREVPEKSP
jgi:hypothetical protein